MASDPQRALIVQPAPAATARACRNLRNVLAHNALELRKPAPRFRWSDFFDDLGEGTDTTSDPRPIEMGLRSFPTLTGDTAREASTATMPGTLAIAAVAGAAAAILFGSLIFMPEMRVHWATEDLPRASQHAKETPAATRLAMLSIEEPSRLALYAPLETLVLSDQPVMPYAMLAAQEALPEEAAVSLDDERASTTPTQREPEAPAETPVTTPVVRKSPPRAAEPARAKEQRPRPKATAASGSTPQVSSQGQSRQANSPPQRTAAATEELKGPSIFNPLTMLLGGPFEASSVPPPALQDR
jgi:hypothetical protein